MATQYLKYLIAIVALCGFADWVNFNQHCKEFVLFLCHWGIEVAR